MNSLKQKIKDSRHFFNLPPNVEQAFESLAIQKNGFAMKFLASFIIVVELLNISRVLFLTNSKLSTLNNRIYFSLYVTLLVSAIVFCLIDQLLKHEKAKRMLFYILTAYFWMFWHVIVNCYDLHRNPNGDITIFSCAVLGLSIFAQLKPRHTLTIATSSFVVLLCLSNHALDTGGYINATISLLLACLIALRVYMLSIVQICQHIEIAKQSDQLQKERADLKSSLEKYDMVLNNTKDYIFEIDFQEDRLVFAKNSLVAHRFGREITNVTTWLQTQTVIYPEHTTQLIQAMQDLSTTKREGDYTFCIRTKEGFDKWYQLRVFVTGDHDTGLTGIGIVSDIDDQHRQVELLTSQAKTDPLTGLLNAVAFKNSYAVAMKNLSENEHLAMFMIDLDNFKTINDTYGHFAGDCVLQKVATILRTTFRDYDFSARLGGDEFAIIMNRVKDVSMIEKKAAQLTTAITNLAVTDKQVHTACSIGIAVTNDKHVQYSELYQRADKVLYEAKGCGKGCYKISD